MRLKKSMVIHGPAGCGKTFNRRRLAQYFNFDLVIDDGWAGKWDEVKNNYMILTNEIPKLGGLKKHFRILSFWDAMKRMSR